MTSVRSSKLLWPLSLSFHSDPWQRLSGVILLDGSGQQGVEAVLHCLQPCRESAIGTINVSLYHVTDTCAVCVCVKEKDPVLATNPDLHFNRSTVRMCGGKMGGGHETH